ncbi:SDR family oxidoreductase [Sorangium sp. So ce1036]|uniref:SDR family oxidoreductase n=1 Tax=Sorangium sp. So ce1036 TaxID=3133328 RepID=UPI003F0E4459
MKYSQPMLSSAAATRNAASSAVTTSVEALMGSRRVVRHLAEQPARAVAPLQPRCNANAKLLLVRPWMASTQAAVAPLTGREGAAILMVSSFARRANVPGTSMYGATKVGLIYLTRSWAIELAPAGIRVNCISPGLTDTPAVRSAARHIPDLVEDQIARALIKRAAPPEEVARVALTLLDERTSGFVTGSNWDVDGGGHLG